MENQRNTDKLSGILIKVGIIAVAVGLCLYFKNTLIYIIIAFVVSLLGIPLINLMRKIKIKGHSAPGWLLAILAMAIILALIILLILEIIPLISNIISDISAMDLTSSSGSNPIEDLNRWLIATFPSLDENFNLTDLLLSKLKELVSFSSVTGLVGSVASIIIDLFVGLFSVMFISFFFLKDDTLFERIICALVPDKHEAMVGKTINEIKQLLSRYFVGLLLEIIGVALVDFLGLWLIARLPINYAITIAFIAGLLNVIPYVGPIIGEVIGVLLGIIIKLGMGVGICSNVWIFALVILAIMLTTQLLDNFVYQPIIYSTSIKAHPLEIFIVFLLAGHLGGVVGMLVAIPAYTVIRVIAIRFFYRFKPIQRLVPDLSEEDKIIENID